MCEPPVYRRHSVPHTIQPDTECLPAYTRRSRPSSRSNAQTSSPQRTTHLYDLTDSKNRPWVTLSVQSCARSSHQMPTFIEDEPIVGTVTLNVEKGDPITGISISVTGKIITGTKTANAFTFLTYSEPLWSKTTGDPQPSSPSSTPSSVQFSGRLSGGYSWPFSFKLPKTVTLRRTPAEQPQTYRLPQTFLERLISPIIQYDLTVNITRKKLRSGSKLRTLVAYIPCTKPEEPSLLRQIAYREGSPLLPPEMDPEGWHTLPIVTINGRLFSSHLVNVDLSLSLAAPLSYTRGTTIPLFLTLSSQDAQALDLLSSQHAINVRLRRNVACGGTALKDANDILETAVWWPAPGGNGHSRNMSGEIKLAKDLKPTSSMAHFTVNYFVIICPFEATGFSLVDRVEQPLFAEPVEIATTFARGPRPKSYAPPRCDSTRRHSVHVPLPAIDSV